MMACGPMAFFLEHFSMELRRESVENLYEKLIDCKCRLLLTIRELAPHFVSHIVSSDASDDDVDPQQIVFLVKSVRNTHLIQQLFDKICKEKYGITLVFILFTKTRWGTVRDAAKRLNWVRMVMCQLPIEIMSNDLNIYLLNDLKNLILTAAFWKGVAAVEVLFSAICSCLSYLEGDESTFSSVYTCFLAVAHHFRTLSPDVRAALDLSNADVDKMHTLVCHCFKTIFSPTHALAFRTDLLFDDLRDNLAKLHGDAFLNLGDLTILQQCKNAIKRMVATDALLNRTIQSEFGLYTIHVEDNDNDFADIFSMPQLMWAFDALLTP
ncbi:unnamed protein product [Sphagnum jensenii]|uniref:Uncharacterized protein n=1 Tax=Sphagnum jensenii TaxID=128206 RepID=A0ABP1B044_9BRYO